MKIAVPKENVAGETRVGLVPESVGKLVKAGHTVTIEKDAGLTAHFLDKAYEDAGATVSADRDKVWKEAELLAKVQRPSDDEVALLSPGSLLIGFLQPLTNFTLAQQLADRKVTAFAMESIPRITRAQSMDALSSMSTVAGYEAVLIAARLLSKFFPMFMTAAGTVPPAKVLIIGAGVAGLQAIATARRLGAVVEAYDTRPVVKEQVMSLGAKFVEIDVGGDTQDAGGYAKQLTPEQIQKQKDVLAQHVKDSDVVITTALVPGKRAPILIPKQAVDGMAPGSVVVDLAAEMGGNCEYTVPGETVVEHGVHIVGITNLPALLPVHASAMYSRNVTTLINHLAPKGALTLNWDDEITKGTCLTHDGGVVNAFVKKLMEEQAAKAAV